MVRILDFLKALVYSELWIGLGCGSLIHYSFLILGLEPDMDLVLFGVFGTIAVYNWQRLLPLSGERPEVHSERHRWKRNNRSTLWTVMGISAVAGLYLALSFSRIFLIGLSVFAVIALFYTLPLGRTGERRGLREIPFIKLVLIGLTWAFVTAFLPLLEGGVNGWGMITLVTIERFVFITAITIPFDIRDLPHDSAAKKTLPQLIGQKRALHFSLDLLIIAFFLEIYVLRTYEQHWLSWLALILGFGCTALLIKRADPERPELYFTGLLDGVMILIPMLAWLASMALN